MPKLLEPPNQDYEVQISHQYHAFLVANVSIHDLGRGRNVEIGLNGMKYNASTSLEANRTAQNLTGLWRATLYIRSKANATLDRNMNLRRIRPITIAQQAPFWTCTGHIERLDSTAGLLEIGVYPSNYETSKFSLITRINPTQIRQLGHAPFVHVTGTLEQHSLMITHIEPRETMDFPRMRGSQQNKPNLYLPNNPNRSSEHPDYQSNRSRLDYSSDPNLFDSDGSGGNK